MSASPTKAVAAAVTGGGGKVRDTALFPAYYVASPHMKSDAGVRVCSSTHTTC